MKRLLFAVLFTVLATVGIWSPSKAAPMGPVLAPIDNSASKAALAYYYHGIYYPYYYRHHYYPYYYHHHYYYHRHPYYYHQHRYYRYY